MQLVRLLKKMIITMMMMIITIIIIIIWCPGFVLFQSDATYFSLPIVNRVSHWVTLIKGVVEIHICISSSLSFILEAIYWNNIQLLVFQF